MNRFPRQETCHRDGCTNQYLRAYLTDIYCCDACRALSRGAADYAEHTPAQIAENGRRWRLKRQEEPMPKCKVCRTDFKTSTGEQFCSTACTQEHFDRLDRIPVCDATLPGQAGVRPKGSVSVLCMCGSRKCRGGCRQ